MAANVNSIFTPKKMMTLEMLKDKLVINGESKHYGYCFATIMKMRGTINEVIKENDERENFLKTLKLKHSFENTVCSHWIASTVLLVIWLIFVSIATFSLCYFMFKNCFCCERSNNLKISGSKKNRYDDKVELFSARRCPKVCQKLYEI